MNTTEEVRLERAISIVLGRFGVDDRPAVRAHLYRAVYLMSWKTIGGKLGVHYTWCPRVAAKGRALLDRAIDRGDLDREALAATLEEARPSLRRQVARDDWD